MALDRDEVDDDDDYSPILGNTTTAAMSHVQEDKASLLNSLKRRLLRYSEAA